MMSEPNRIPGDFACCRLPVIDNPVFRMGVAGNYGIDSSVRLKQEGKIKAMGTSIHDRQRIGPGFGTRSPDDPL